MSHGLSTDRMHDKRTTKRKLKVKMGKGQYGNDLGHIFKYPNVETNTT